MIYEHNNIIICLILFISLLRTSNVYNKEVNNMFLNFFSNFTFIYYFGILCT